MTLPEVLGVMERAEAENKTIVRLHTGDPSLYGAIREQMDRLEKWGSPMTSAPESAPLTEPPPAWGRS